MSVLLPHAPTTGTITVGTTNYRVLSLFQLVDTTGIEPYLLPAKWKRNAGQRLVRKTSEECNQVRVGDILLKQAQKHGFKKARREQQIIAMRQFWQNVRLAPSHVPMDTVRIIYV